MRAGLSSILFAGLLILVFLSQTGLNGQTTNSGALAGVVSDQTGAVIPEADLEIEDLARGTIRSTKTDHEGAYQFSFLVPSRYALTVSHSGFRVEKRIVNVLLGPTVSVNVELALAQTSADVIVTSEAPLIQAENGDVSATVSQSLVSEAPNPGNDLTYIVQTTPGVLMNTDGPIFGNFSILGMPSISYQYTIDGMDDPVTGPLGLTLGQNQIQEVTVVTTGYSGQFGSTAGGNINYASKAGTNVFHGNAQYYWNGSALNANDWFNNALGNPKPFDIAHQWAGSFGGPIKKEKLFFFLDTEGLRVILPVLMGAVIPSPQFESATLANLAQDKRFGTGSATYAFYKRLFDLYNAAPGADSAPDGTFFPGDLGCLGLGVLGPGVPCARHFYASRSNPSQDMLLAGRADWSMTKNDRAFLRLQDEGGHNTVNSSPINSVWDGQYHQRSHQVQLIETHSFLPTLTSQLLIAGAYTDARLGVDDLTKSLAALPTTINFYTLQWANFVGNGFQARFYNSQYQISEDLVKTWGNHSFGFGMNFKRIYWHGPASTPNAVGGLDPQTLDAFYQGGVDPNSPDTDFTRLAQTFPAEIATPVTFYHLGLYGQDEWHARSNLTFTLALRAAHHSNPVCENGCFARLTGPFDSVSHDPNQPYNQAIRINQKQAFQNIDSILWSPRLSFAWQPLGISHNLVLRGGIGIFHDPVQEGIVFAFANNPPFLNSFTATENNIAPGETSSLFKDAAASNAAFLNAFTNNGTLAQIKQVVPNFAPPGITVPAGRLHSPQYQRWSLQLQQALGAATSLSVGYFGHHGIHEFVQNPSANAWGFGSLPAGRCPDPVPDCAPDPRFSFVTEFNSNAISNYHGMVVSLQHRSSRWSHGLFQANYTYSHAFDEVSNGGLNPFANWNRMPFTVFPQDPNNLRGAYGPADYDVRHSFNASYVWEVPIKAALGGRGADSLVKGWQVSGTIFARGGLPYTVLDYFESGYLNAKNYGALLYAVPTGPIGPGPSCGKGAAIPLVSHPCQPAQVFLQPDGSLIPNPDARFVQVGCITGFNTGTLPGPSGPCDGPLVTFAQGRNRFRGPSYFNTDFTIIKNTTIPHWENATLGIGFQFFNFLNHPNFGFPNTAPGPGPGIGYIGYLEQPPTSILGSNSNFGADVAPRMIQVKAEIKF